MLVNSIDCKLLHGYSATRNFKVLEQTTTSNKRFFSDYGYESDDVEANFTLAFFYNLEDDMDNLATLNDELIQGSSVSIECGDGEYLFGSEIDYSSALTAYVTNVNKPTRTAYERFELNITLIIKNPPKNTSISDGSVSSLLIPLNYSYGYQEERALFSGATELSTLSSYTGSNSISFGSFNKIETNAPIKTYLSYSLRVGKTTIPEDWKTYTKAFEQFDLDYMKMSPKIVESFPKWGISVLEVEFVGVNK